MLSLPARYKHDTDNWPPVLPTPQKIIVSAREIIIFRLSNNTVAILFQFEE